MPATGFVVRHIGSVSDDLAKSHLNVLEGEFTYLRLNAQFVSSLEYELPNNLKRAGALRGHEFLHGFVGLSHRLNSLVVLGVALSHHELGALSAKRLLYTHYREIPGDFLEKFILLAGMDFSLLT